MSERYHKAARDGYLALLKEATRKDLNTPDTDGMTPTLWAAYHGQIEALQLICSRGGEANMCDIWGNTPLHHAAINGHIHIVTFLINFGANIWALDNDFHSAMDAAAGKDQMECVRVLDTAATKQNITHPKQVARLKEKARKDAEKQIKECERLKKKHENRRNKKYTQEMEAGSSGGGSMQGETVASLTQQFSKMSASQKSGSVSSFLKGSLQKKHKKKEGKVTLEGQLGNDVIFVSQEGSNGLRTNVRDVFGDENRAPERSEEAREFEDGDHFGGHESLFKRAGLGNMLFRRNFTLGMSIEEEMSTENEMEDAGSRLRNELLKSDWGLKAADNLEDVDEDLEEELPWNEEDIGLDDYEPGTTPLEAFLASQNMMEFIPFLAREQIDLESLMLCSEDDLRGIQLPLGPRKKLLSAVDKRKMIIKNPNKLTDTVL